MGSGSGALTTILDNVGEVIESAFQWVDAPVEAITSNGLIFLAAVGIPLVGIGIGIVRRLFKLRA